MANKEMGPVPSSTVSSDDTSSVESISPEIKRSLKRKHSSSDTDFTDSSESRHSQERKNPSDVEGITTSTSGGSDMRSSSESPILGSEIPLKCSDWSDQVFPLLRVEVMPEVFTPYVVFSSYSDFLESQKNKRSKIIAMMNDSLAERKVVLDCYNYAMENVLDLEYEHIDHIPVHRVEELFENTETLDKSSMRDWMRQFTENDLKAGGKDLKEKFKRVHQRINEYLWQLLYMVNKRQFPEPEELSEGMFQELFLRFAKIFELDLVGVPNVGRYTFDVSGTETSSVPDALVINPRRKNSVLAVVEVKKFYSKEIDSETQRKLRKVTKVQNPIQHVDSKLKGQHVGEILSVLQYSLFGPTGIFGLIVQATEITVVAFATDEKYLECVRKGRLPKQDCATVKYSEKCNILSKKGRLELVKTFLDMSALMKCL
ncbi:uncharacterized protein LOC133199833 [Saccostrea echinata]|uniref:uncharacterized protein LOC133199833 n=1 Tax=Saccostrea echinata TaxID=191078 RepID=UPI002A822872|nr:uncharacterized protein LOC133199833 [Saccostrea echinata]